MANAAANFEKLEILRTDLRTRRCRSLKHVSDRNRELCTRKTHEGRRRARDSNTGARYLGKVNCYSTTPLAHMLMHTTLAHTASRESALTRNQHHAPLLIAHSARDRWALDMFLVLARESFCAAKKVSITHDKAE